MAIFPLAPDQTIAQMWSNGVRGVVLCHQVTGSKFLRGRQWVLLEMQFSLLHYHRRQYVQNTNVSKHEPLQTCLHIPLQSSSFTTMQHQFNTKTASENGSLFESTRHKFQAYVLHKIHIQNFYVLILLII